MGMTANLKFTTLIQRLSALKPETILKADEDLAKHINLGFRVVSEIVLAGDDVFTRVIRLEGEQSIVEPEPESAVGKMVREHGSERANQIYQQEAVDRARGAFEARRAFYRNAKSLPVPVFPIFSEE